MKNAMRCKCLYKAIQMHFQRIANGTSMRYYTK